MLKKLVAELIGTFILVFAITGAVTINQQTGGAIGHVGVAITVGLALMMIIFSIGNISGAHVNPAVSISMAIAKKLAWKDLAPYIIMQVAGAFIATLVLRSLFPNDVSLGTTVPSGTDMQSFIMETILTFLLVTSILASTANPNNSIMIPAIAIGGTLGLDAMFGGPVSGASMNPALSLAPSVITNNMSHLWVYIAGPLVGGILAVIIRGVIAPKE